MANQAEEWIDVSVPLREDMPVWPGEVVPLVRRTTTICNGEGANVTLLCIGAHTGTHVDAPCHFLEGEAGVESLPLSALLGAGWITTIGEEGPIGADAFEKANIPPGTKRLLLRTCNEARWGPEASEFWPAFAALSADGARWVVDAGIELLAIDYLSVQSLSEDTPDVHRSLLRAGIVIVEGVYLRNAPDGACEVVCLPLLLPGADGAPARVVVRPL